MKPDLDSLRKQVKSGVSDASSSNLRTDLGQSPPPVSPLWVAGLVLFGLFGVYFIGTMSKTEPQRSPAPEKPVIKEPKTSPVPAITHFTFTVCNRSNVTASVATMGRQSSAADWVVQGWTTVHVGQCIDVGNFAVGYFYAAATGVDGSRWGDPDITLCVRSQRFSRVNRGGYSCQTGEQLFNFTRFNVMNRSQTWNLLGRSAR